MYAIILAAGIGSRLLPLTQHVPKCLLEVDEDYSIIEDQLAAVERTAEIDRVLVVLGYRAYLVEAKLASMQVRVPLEVVYNPFYDRVNALMSLWLALQRRPSEFLVLNGDTLFSPSCLQDLLSAPRDKTVCLQASRVAVHQEDAVKVVVKGELITDIGKRVPREATWGESAGAMRFLGVGAEAAITMIEEMARQPANHTEYWYTLVRQMAGNEVPIHLHECSPDEWLEIDDHRDLELARTVIRRWRGRKHAVRRPA